MARAGFSTSTQELERLQDLRDLGLHEESRIPELERLPRLAAEACDSPWAGISVVEEDTQRFLAVEGPFSRHSPREQAPCSQAITHPDEVFVLEDLTEAEAFRQAPLVEDTGVRFYAAAPIRSQRGHGLGTVCVFDERPRQLEPGHREALAALGHVVGLQLRLRRRTEELERANEEKDQFTTFVSHELTDPVSQVVGNLELLRMHLDDADGETRELIGEALEGVGRMDRMIRDLLRYSQTSGGELEQTAVDLEALLADVAASVKAEQDSPGVTVEIQRLPTVAGDRGLLRRVVSNLLENALRHGGDPDTIRVRAEDEEGAWRIWVEDDGKGIRPEDQAQLFELFETGSSSEKTSGIGLALCQRIVERHGGEIGVESQPGEGARFWFTLPKTPLTTER